MQIKKQVKYIMAVVIHLWVVELWVTLVIEYVFLFTVSCISHNFFKIFLQFWKISIFSQSKNTLFLHIINMFLLHNDCDKGNILASKWNIKGRK